MTGRDMLRGNWVNISNLRRLATAGLLAATLALPTAHGALASDIKIVVDDQAITSFDIQARARLLQLAAHIAPGASTKAAQEELIDETLHLREAARRGIEIPEDMVDQAMAGIAGRSKLSPTQFAAAVEHAGVSMSTFRARIKAQIAWSRVVRGAVQQQQRAEQMDLIAQMRNKEKAQSDVTAEDYVLQRVVFAVRAQASPAEVAARKREADALRARFQGCDTIKDVTKGLKDVAVINIGRKLANEVPAALRDELSKTDVGRLTAAERTDLGFAMIAVCQKTKVVGESAIGANYDAEQMSKQAEDVSKDLTQKLRQKANIVYR